MMVTLNITINIVITLNIIVSLISHLESSTIAYKTIYGLKQL